MKLSRDRIFVLSTLGACVIAVVVGVWWSYRTIPANEGFERLIRSTRATGADPAALARLARRMPNKGPALSFGGVIPLQKVTALIDRGGHWVLEDSNGRVAADVTSAGFVVLSRDGVVPASASNEEAGSPTGVVIVGTRGEAVFANREGSIVVWR